MVDNENKAVITFDQFKDAEFALVTSKFTIKSHSIWARPIQKVMDDTQVQETFPQVNPININPDCNLVIKNLPD